LLQLFKPGVPNLGDARGLKDVHLGTFVPVGDGIDVKGDAGTKRLGTPDLNCNN